MKRIALYLMLVMSLSIHGQNSKNYTISISEKDFSFTKNGDTLTIASADDKAYKWGDTLDLALPCVGINILIEPKDDYAGISYEVHEELLEQNVIVDFNATDMPTNNYQNVFHTHQIIYTKKSYPENNVQFTGLHMMDGYKYLSFVICPFRYDAEYRNLYLQKKIDLHINLKSIHTNNSRESKAFALGNNMREVVKKLTINGNELETMYYKDIDTKDVLTTISTPYQYVIVTDETLKSSFEKLAHWKTIKGIKSKVITVEDCYDAYPNLSPQLAIKTVLSNYYYNYGLEYVLLGGDTDIVPAQICYLPPYTDETSDTPADLYYACLDNNFAWDADSNQVYGESTDSIDFSPEFIVTRSSVSTLTEAENFVNRIVEYESSPKIDEWTNNVLSCGYGFGYQADYVYNYGINPYWNGTRFKLFENYSDHPNGADYDATGEHFQAEFEKGYTFIDEFSHGWLNKWGWLENWTLYKLDKASSLVNNNYTTITTIACFTNAFDKVSTDFPDELEYYTTCLSESFIRNPNSGVLAYFGSSREGWVAYSYYFNKKFYEYLLPSNDKQFGRATMLAKNAFIPQIPSTGYNYYRWLIMSLNPIGDPEMPIFTETPQKFTNINIAFSNGSLSVTTGVAGCRICVSSVADYGDSYYELANNTNSASFCGVNDDCFLCITKPGFIPYVARVGNSVFLQNETIINNLPIFSTTTYAGSDVTISKPQGPVSIEKGKVTNKCNGTVTIKNNFEVKIGAELEIKN